MSDLSKRLPTTLAMVLFAYGAIRFLPLTIFATVLFLLISLAVYEFVTLTQPRVFSLPVIWISGLLVGAHFTFPATVELSLSLGLALMLNGLYFLFAVNDRQRLTSFVRDIGIHFLAVIYLYLPLFFILELKRCGANYLFFLIWVIAIGDSGAYFIGRAWGKHKIYPVASPRKSLEGVLAAVITATAAGWVSIWLFPVTAGRLLLVATAGLIGLFSQLSDPVESLFKRAADRKDSGNLLPGHGGVLDRLDSYIFCAPLLYFIVRFFWR